MGRQTLRCRCTSRAKYNRAPGHDGRPESTSSTKARLIVQRFTLYCSLNKIVPVQPSKNDQQLQHGQRQDNAERRNGTKSRPVATAARNERHNPGADIRSNEHRSEEGSDRRSTGLGTMFMTKSARAAHRKAVRAEGESAPGPATTPVIRLISDQRASRSAQSRRRSLGQRELGSLDAQGPG